MHILITVVGKRTEHWLDLFAALADRPDVTLTVVAADVSPLTEQGLCGLADRYRNFRPVLRPHLLGEDSTGHMASVLFGPGAGHALRDVPAPDVVHILGEAAYLSTWQAIRLRDRIRPGTPVTLYAAQNIVMRFPFPFPLLERRAYRAVSHAFPITPSALRVLRAKGYTGPATVVPLGVDTGVFRPLEQERPQTFTVGFVGRLEPHKGIGDLLLAAELLDCDLQVVGDGTLSGEVQRASERRPGRVRLTPWADHGELPSLLARMSVLALPSVEIVQRNVVPWIGIPLREQFGRVLIEAMACGVPVVGSDIGDISHVIGSTGLLSPAGDAAALADRLARIRDEPGLARRLAAEGRRRAANEFSWRRIADELCHTWQHLAHGTASDRRTVTRPTHRAEQGSDQPAVTTGPPN
ncbi:glycosyltransferase [Streptomyces sp. TRM49041]|uniref:glycosyltransferase family 4 protein n=1 Tax=Streptomyces sp. TRM49041 TaxID=2603216 RepID=UPI0011EDC612|nr:glycosyltransferase [Streptomyces sp. TRM49041]